MKSIPNYLLHTEHEIHHEFMKLQKFDQSNYSHQEKCAKHQNENRYSNVVPYKRTTVLLNHPTKYTTDGYINASYVSPNFIRDDDNDELNYIATQGPLENTVGTFWQCIIEQLLNTGKDVVSIIMLTELYEGIREKCFDYIENMENDLYEVIKETCQISDNEDNFNYLGVKFLNNGGIELREFKFKLANNEEKIIRHFWVRKWTDFGVPGDDDDNNEFLIKWMCDNGDNEGYKIVHCSAGVGRSGTFIAMDWYYNMVIKNGLKFDENEKHVVYRCVKNLRKCRVMMVQSYEQYKYLYQTLIDFHRKS